MAAVLLSLSTFSLIDGAVGTSTDDMSSVDDLELNLIDLTFFWNFPNNYSFPGQLWFLREMVIFDFEGPRARPLRSACEPNPRNNHKKPPILTYIIIKTSDWGFGVLG